MLLKSKSLSLIRLFLALVRANRLMVEQLDFLIAYIWPTASNASNLLEYAKSRAGKGLLSITLLERD